jgi:hypothetical protein
MLSHENFKLNKWQAFGRIIGFNILYYIDIDYPLMFLKMNGKNSVVAKNGYIACTIK